MLKGYHNLNFAVKIGRNLDLVLIKQQNSIVAALSVGKTRQLTGLTTSSMA